MDYKKYSLENLENWLHDAMESGATPQEIYDVVIGVVKESYYHHKHHAGYAYDLLNKFTNHTSAGIVSLTGPDSDEPIVLGPYNGGVEEYEKGIMERL